MRLADLSERQMRQQVDELTDAQLNYLRHLIDKRQVGFKKQAVAK